MNYSSGVPVQLGDHVAIEHGQTPGRVTDIVEANVDMAQSNVDEPGLMIESAPFGLVFWPTSSPDPVVFVYRASQASGSHDA